MCSLLTMTYPSRGFGMRHVLAFVHRPWHFTDALINTALQLTGPQPYQTPAQRNSRTSAVLCTSQYQAPLSLHQHPSRIGLSPPACHLPRPILSTCASYRTGHLAAFSTKTLSSYNHSMLMLTTVQASLKTSPSTDVHCLAQGWGYIFTYLPYST